MSGTRVFANRLILCGECYHHKYNYLKYNYVYTHIHSLYIILNNNNMITYPGSLSLSYLKFSKLSNFSFSEHPCLAISLCRALLPVWSFFIFLSLQAIHIWRFRTSTTNNVYGNFHLIFLVIHRKLKGLTGKPDQRRLQDHEDCRSPHRGHNHYIFVSFETFHLPHWVQ